MSKKEQSEIKLSIEEMGHAYWIASSYQRAIRKFLKNNEREELLEGDHYATAVVQLKEDHPMAWALISTEASRIRRQDMGDKAKQLVEEEPAYLEKTDKEKVEIVQEALIDEYFELSQKAPMSLRALESILSSYVEKGRSEA